MTYLTPAEGVISPRYYPLRGDQIDENTAQLLKNPSETRLSPEERQAAFDYERWLTQDITINYKPPQYEDTQDQSKISEPSAETVRGIEGVCQIKINTSSFDLPYLMTPEGRNELATAFKVDPEEVNFSTTEELKEFLYSFNYDSLPKDQTKLINKLQRVSIQHTEDSIVEQITDDGGHYTMFYKGTPPLTIAVIRNPDQLVKKISCARELKRLHKEEKKRIQQEIKSSGDESELKVLEAKLTVLEIHSRRLNAMLADLYSTSWNLLKQCKTASSTSNTKYARPLHYFGKYKEDVEKNTAGLKKSELPNPSRFFNRLDLYMNGAAARKSEEEMVRDTTRRPRKSSGRDYTAISTHASEIETIRRRPNTSQGGVLTALIDQEVLSHTLPPEVIRGLLEEVLREWNILSIEPPDTFYANTDRENGPSDGKIQAVVHPKHTAHSYSHKQRVLNTPENPKTQQNISDIAPIVAHEVIHAWQGLNSQQIEFLTILEKVGLPRTSIIAEAGAIDEERKAKKYFFGQTRPTSLAYLVAAEQISAGNGFMHAVRAFYNQYISENPNDNKEKTIRRAIDRVRRLYRNGGNPQETGNGNLTNSAPFVYLEQDSFAQTARRHGIERIMYMRGGNPYDLAQLRRVGLLDDGMWDQIKPPSPLPHIILEPHIRMYIESLKTNSEIYS